MILFEKVWMCLAADNVKDMDKLLIDNAELWNEAAVHDFVEGGDSGRTLLSFALEKGSARCVELLLDCGCDPNKAVRNTLENIMSEDNTTVVGVEKKIVKGYEDVFEWEDKKKAQDALFDMYDHGLSATVDEVKTVLNEYYWDESNAGHIEERDSWISGTPQLLSSSVL